MEAPAGKRSREELRAAFERHVAEHYAPKGSGFVCKKDGAEIRQTTLYVSVHAKAFGDMCAGSGEVERLPLPYCPTCEGVPSNTSTCVHV